MQAEDDRAPSVYCLDSRTVPVVTPFQNTKIIFIKNQFKLCWKYICAISVIVGLVFAAVSIPVILNFPLPLNDTSIASFCPGEPNVALVLKNFSNPDIISAKISLLSPENTIGSTIIDLVGSIQPVNKIYSGKNISLQQARDIRLYVLPGSLFTITFSFTDESMNNNLTVEFMLYTQAGHPGKTYSSQPIGPCTRTNSVSFSANESSYIYVKFVIKKDLGIAGYYDFTFVIKEIHNLNHKCTLNSTISSCTLSPTLPGRNLILGMPPRDSETAQCHPIISVSLVGQKKRIVPLSTIPIAVLIVSFVIAALLITVCVSCVTWIRHDRLAYEPLQ